MFYNLKAVLTADELAALYRMIRYEKLNVLLIEDMPRKRLEQYAKMTIVDEDLCIF